MEKSQNQKKYRLFFIFQFFFRLTHPGTFCQTSFAKPISSIQISLELKGSQTLSSPKPYTLFCVLTCAKTICLPLRKRGWRARKWCGKRGASLSAKWEWIAREWNAALSEWEQNSVAGVMDSPSAVHISYVVTSRRSGLSLELHIFMTLSYCGRLVDLWNKAQGTFLDESDIHELELKVKPCRRWNTVKNK